MEVNSLSKQALMNEETIIKKERKMRICTYIYCVKRE